MSYCRWSCKDFQCDLYVYADVDGGYSVHVAGNRVVYKQPLPPEVPFDRENLEAWMARHKQIMEMVQEAERVPIKLPHAGESYNLQAEECAEFLRKLAALGYRFPAHVIDAILEDGDNP